MGELAAQPSICLALSDTNKLVRWRAARFLADLGTSEALSYLEKAADDAEFEVRLEIEAAIARITRGKQISMPMWKKILQSTESEDG
ncbi:MAG: HEAT repeat domain-containing protein [Candidatus Obscuribacterales bacterium]|nr:HEAT repeat domain-containing protein [Candidatus Obscuribacterales bacterium]